MNSAAIDVVGIGNAIVDVIAHADERFIVDQGLAARAMTLIDAARADSLYRAMGPAIESSGGSAGNTMAGIASLVQAQLAQSVAPTVLVGKELDVVAAVVLGGASLMGGVGTVFGTFLGLALLAILQNGIILLGVSSYWSPFFVGLVILISVSATAWSQRERRTRSARP